ncbi:MAG TPA: hypothetical protein DD671_17820, partial [Balneolaceae bacterium]|nr:hypothetical protein [Balneolaceae bacterium]
INRITSGSIRWSTTFQYSGTTGTQNFKFASTSFGDPWGNQWASVTDVAINTFTSFPFASDGSLGNNSITVENDKWYTVVFNDNGYSATEAVFMETSASPVSITSVSGVPASVVTENQPVTINVELDKAKSS